MTRGGFFFHWTVAGPEKVAKGRKEEEIFWG